MSSSELSLSAAKAKFFEATKEERRLLAEHKKLLKAHIDECIEQGKEEAVYEVPSVLSGSFANYDVYEITLLLIKQCRNGGFQVQLLQDTPPVMRLWGWYDLGWMDMDGPKNERGRAQRRTVVLSKKKPGTKLTAITPEQASVMAHRGTLSKQLQASLARTRKNI